MEQIRLYQDAPQQPQAPSPSAPIRLYSDAPAPKAANPASGPIRLYNDAPAPTVTAPAPTTSDHTTIGPDIPATAFKGDLGGGYGTSNVKDPASGKPLLTN